MSDILDTIKYLVNREVEEILFTGNVTSLDPLQVKLSPSDDAINVRMLNVFGIKIGSNVLMIKYLNKFVVIGVIGNVAQSFCLLTRTTTQSIPSGTNTFMDFSSGSVILDPESMFDGTNKITIPTTGLYQINFQFRVADSTSTTVRIANLYLNGSQIASIAASPDASGRFGTNFSLNLNLSEDDYLQVVLYFGTTLNIGSYDNTYFSVIPLNSGSALGVNQDANETKCSLIRDSAQTISTSTTTKVTFGSGNVDYDPLDMFNDSNNRIIVPSAGLYEISICSRWETNSGDSDRIIYLYVNGTAIVSNVMNTGSAGRAGNTITLKKYLYVNDYVEFYCWQDSGGDLDIGGTGYSKVYFSVEKCI